MFFCVSAGQKRSGAQPHRPLSNRGEVNANLHSCN
ncbi:MAG: phage DNA packaging protein J [Lachnospiraceae bacterium]|nr:phage DNA packaging protein J [Lachnospiraceae bacterium]